MLAPDGVESWTVIGDDLRPVDPVERYLAWLSNVGRSPNTVRAYAHDLELFWTFLAGLGAAWDLSGWRISAGSLAGCVSRPRTSW